MIAAVVLLVILVLALAAIVGYLLNRREREIDDLLASHAQSLAHADERRRRAEERAGRTELDLLETRRELHASGYRSLIGRRVVAMLVEDRSVRGVLKETYADGHTLAHPEWLQGAQPAGMGGELFLPAEKVLMLQVFEAEAS
ncbi:MAG: hypothetical protein M3340_02170 [Actinomycetota bacterium]|nr:hypothetical protein [Actinomycetota bacterium]